MADHTRPCTVCGDLIADDEEVCDGETCGAALERAQNEFWDRIVALAREIRAAQEREA